ncbi:tRNA-modifying protein YgfZ [Ningiella sp. W23]|uniref:tRNA-modifying protein YgfZ n=1 Tax=Ningiella sp. W23 TaxID=3023715 RepID=UPI00375802E9
MSDFLVDLPKLEIIRIAGEQRHDYLHGQVTVDTKSIPEDKAKYAAHCDFKGKMWSAFYLTQFENSFHMILPTASASSSMTELKKYGVFSKVEIDNVGTDFKVIGVHGKRATIHLKALFSDLSDEHLHVSANEFGYAITFNDSSLRYLTVLKIHEYEHLKSLAANDFDDDIALWQMLEIEAGIALLEAPENIGEFVPQMLNLQCLDAIDFGKGCYMGQEVIARTKFLGKNKRASFLLSARGSDSLDIQPGDIIEKAVGNNFRRGGVVVRCAKANGKTKLLAVLSNDTSNSDVLRLKESQVPLNLEALPYSLETTPS